MTNSTAPTNDRRRTDTRARLVESSLRLFNEKGYAGTTVAAIEGSVGLRPGSGGLYRHFGSKDELLLEAVRSYRTRVADLRRQLAGARQEPPVGPPAADLAAALRQLVSALAGFLAGEQPIVRLSLESAGLPESIRTVIGDAWDEGYGIVADVFEHHGVAPSHSTILAISAVGALNHYFSHLGMWRQRPGQVAPDAYIDAWAEQFQRLAAFDIGT